MHSVCVCPLAEAEKTFTGHRDPSHQSLQQITANQDPLDSGGDAVRWAAGRKVSQEALKVRGEKLMDGGRNREEETGC